MTLKVMITTSFWSTLKILQSTLCQFNKMWLHLLGKECLILLSCKVWFKVQLIKHLIIEMQRLQFWLRLLSCRKKEKPSLWNLWARLFKGLMKKAWVRFRSQWIIPVSLSVFRTNQKRKALWDFVKRSIHCTSKPNMKWLTLTNEFSNIYKRI